MKTFKFDATSTRFYKNQLEGKSFLDQIIEITKASEILSDAFIATYISGSFQAAVFEDRGGITSLQSVFNRILKDIVNGLAISEKCTGKLQWNALNINEDVFDLLVHDIQSYMDSSNSLIHVFDNFYAFDAHTGEVPEDFRLQSVEVRDFFLMILGKALCNAVDNGADTSATLQQRVSY